MKRIVLAVALVAASASHAMAMDVATFLTKADVVQAQGLGAMFSQDARDLMAELTQATRALREERLAAEAAGRTPAYCPRGGAPLNQEQIVEAMRAVPAAERANTQVRDALRAAYAVRYPC